MSSDAFDGGAVRLETQLSFMEERNMKPSSFKQWWNGLFHNRPPEDDAVEWLMDVFGFFPINIAVIVLIVGAFSIWLWYTDRKRDREYKEMLKRTEEQS